jgi:DNA adenine methylase
MEDIKLKPILKWAGGKIRIIGKIKDKVTISDRYVEPFIGGGSVFLTLKPTKAILNDINPYLITMYKTVRDKPDELILKLKEYEKKNTKEEYYEIRSKGIKNDDDVEQSAILIYINKTCFRGLYRENSKGGFNVPYGNYKKPLICNETNIKNISTYLNENDIKFFNLPYQEFLGKCVETDFVYLDPPYFPMTKTQFTKYNKGDFTTKDHDNLFKIITEGEFKFLMSNSPADEIKEMFSDYETETFTKSRAINVKQGKTKTKVNEILIWN